MPTLETKVGRLYYRATGSGPAILLWHSWLNDGRIWDDQVESLERRYRVIVVDGPGHGRSETPVHPYTLEDCADATLAVLDAEHVEAAMLVGLSWGGMTVLRAALRAPQRVLALGLLSTTADAEPQRNVLACQAFAEGVHRFGMALPMRLATLMTMFGRTSFLARRGVVQRENARLIELDRRGIRWSTRAVVTERHAIRHRLGGLNMPTLVAVGAEDRCLPPAHSRRLARAIKGAELVILPRAGHLISVEAPDAVRSLLHDLAARAFAPPKSGVTASDDALETSSRRAG